MKRIVVKIGGALLNAPLDELWSGLEELLFGAEVVLVHGGGPQTTEMAIKLDHEPIIVQGRRVTSALDLDILKWVIRGELNVNLVAAAGVAGIRAVGMSGADSRLIQVEKRPLWHLEDQEVDFGHVGDFVQADVTALQALLQAGVLPVVCPPGVDAQGKLYNINADTVALELASAIQADELILVTESGGVLDADQHPIRRLRQQHAIEGVGSGWIAGGMKVKTDIGFEALNRGVSSVWIVALGSVSSKQKGTQLIGGHHV